jgi:hypothetical protein
MTPREWYRAEIRCAVMVEGKQGPRDWEDAVYFFLAENEECRLEADSGNRLARARWSPIRPAVGRKAVGSDYEPATPGE